MSKPIKPLSLSQRNLIRGPSIISSYHSIVEEIVLNSLDAFSTSIQIRLYPSSFSIEICDNGCGMNKLMLRNHFGNWHHTNKSFEHDTYYGFRGEAVAAICSIADVLVYSKTNDDENIYTKQIPRSFMVMKEDNDDEHMNNSKIGFNRLSDKSLSLPLIWDASTSSSSSTKESETGTIIRISNIFGGLAVRQKATNMNVEMTKIREFIRSMSILHHRVSFRLAVCESQNTRRDGRSGVKEKAGGSNIDESTSDNELFVHRNVLDIPNHQSVIARAVSLHPHYSLLLHQMQSIDFTYETPVSGYSKQQFQYRVVGLLSPPLFECCHWNKEFQYAYVDKRYMKSLDIVTTHINNVYRRLFQILQQQKGPNAKHANLSGRGKQQNMYPCFILQLRCYVKKSESVDNDNNTCMAQHSSAQIYDLLCEPDKTVAVFRNPLHPLLAIKGGIALVLKQYQPHLFSTETEGSFDGEGNQSDEQGEGMGISDNDVGRKRKASTQETSNDKDTVLRINVDTFLDEMLNIHALLPYHRSSTIAQDHQRQGCSTKSNNQVLSESIIDGHDDSDAESLLPANQFLRYEFGNENADFFIDSPSDTIVLESEAISETSSDARVYQADTQDKLLNHGVWSPPLSESSFDTKGWDVNSHIDSRRGLKYRKNSSFDKAFSLGKTPSQQSDSLSGVKHTGDASCYGVSVNNDETLGQNDFDVVVYRKPMYQSSEDGDRDETDCRTQDKHDDVSCTLSTISALSQETTTAISSQGNRHYWGTASVGSDTVSGSGQGSMPFASSDDGVMLEHVSLLASDTQQRLTQPVAQFTNVSTQEHVPATARASSNLSMLRPLKLTCDSLKMADVVGQVDNKYILLYYDGFLLAADQHALDERVLLEKIQKEVMSCLEQQDQKDSNDNGIGLSAREVDETLLLTTDLSNALLSRRTAVERWRFKVYPPRFVSTGNDANSSAYTLVQVPCIATEQLTVDDLLEFLHHIASNLDLPDKLLQPPAYHRIVCSLSCRRAIKFGDFLSNPVCKNLVHDVLKTNHPFQCAHGRISMVPLFSLTDAGIHAQLDKEEGKKPRFDSLFQQ
jgi:DNA mismatch repair ATPase MutL